MIQWVKSWNVSASFDKDLLVIIKRPNLYKKGIF